MLPLSSDELQPGHQPPAGVPVVDHVHLDPVVRRPTLGRLDVADGGVDGHQHDSPARESTLFSTTAVRTCDCPRVNSSRKSPVAPAVIRCMSRSTLPALTETKLTAVCLAAATASCRARSVACSTYQR